MFGLVRELNGRYILLVRLKHGCARNVMATEDAQEWS